MAKSFYSQEETREKLGMTENQIKDLVRNGQLREFRDAGKVNYKVGEVDKLAAEFADDSDDDADGSSSGGSGLGGSGLGGSLSGSLSQFDMLSTGELTLEDTGTGDSTGGAPDKPETAKPGSASRSKTDMSGVSGLEDSDLAKELSLSADESLGGGSFADSMKTGDLVLEPVGSEDDSGINLSKEGTADAISLDDTVADKNDEDEKEGTVVSSIGVSVFDDDDVEVEADPLAQTVVAGGSDALGIDSTGSGSGLLDLTRESDDTSLGAELLDEIYPADEDESSGEMGDETRAGLADAAPESDSGGTDFAEAETAAAASAPAAVAVTRTRVEYAPDAMATGFSWMLGASVLVMCLAGVTCAAAVRGVWPSALQILADNMLIVGGACLGVTVIALGIGFMLGRRAEK